MSASIKTVEPVEGRPLPAPPPKSQSVKPVYVLIACLCVVAALFAGSMIIGYVAWQANRNSGSAMQSDQP